MKIHIGLKFNLQDVLELNTDKMSIDCNFIYCSRQSVDYLGTLSTPYR